MVQYEMTNSSGFLSQQEFSFSYSVLFFWVLLCFWYLQPNILTEKQVPSYFYRRTVSALTPGHTTPPTLPHHILPGAEAECVFLYLSFATAQSTATVRPVRQKSNIRKGFPFLTFLPLVNDFLFIEDSKEQKETNCQFREYCSKINLPVAVYSF